MSTATRTIAGANAPLPRGYWSLVRRRFCRRKGGVAGLVILAGLAGVAVLAPLLAASVPLVIRLDEPVRNLLGSQILLPAGLSFPAFAVLEALEITVLAAALAVVCWLLLRFVFARWRPRRDREDRRSRWPSALAASVFVLGVAWAFGVHESARNRLAQADFHEIEAGLADGEWSLWPPVPFGPDYRDRKVDAWLRPLWLGYGERDIARAERFGGPEWRARAGAHALGTDDKRRDVFAMLIHGTRISLSVGVIAVAIYVAIGLVLGALAGYYGGIVDAVILRAVEIVSCFPSLVLVITVLAIFPPSLYLVMVVIGLVGWPTVARLVRAEFLRLRQQDFVQAAIALGARERRVIFRHILPNAISPVLVTATFGVAAAILMESALSFIGIGVPLDLPTWGNILRTGRGMPQVAWWVSLFPGLAILVTIVSYNLCAEALRDAIDPRLAEGRG